MNRYWALFLIFSLWFHTACGPSPTKKINDAPSDQDTASNKGKNKPPLVQTYSANSPRVTLMTWNLENLYDTKNDPDKDDETFLPIDVKMNLPDHLNNCLKLSAKSWQKKCIEWDWNQDTLDLKLLRIARVIRSVHGGKGPDVLVVQEVENLWVLQKLVNDHLSDLGYTVHLIENKDLRGIDVGLITRLPVQGSPQLVSMGSSRPALKALLKLPDATLITVFGVHFPIAATPIERRLKMLKNLSQLAKQSPAMSVALGDFNFPKDEQEIHDLEKKHLKPQWIPAQKYCQGCLGTTYETYTQDWSFLDMILVDQRFFKLSSLWTLDKDSVKIHNPIPFQTNKYGSPADFRLPWASGVSDHWPLLIQLVKTDTF